MLTNNSYSDHSTFNSSPITTPRKNKKLIIGIILSSVAIVLVIVLSVALTHHSEDSDDNMWTTADSNGNPSSDELSSIDYLTNLNLTGSVNATQISTILSLVAIAENSTPQWWMAYDYAENIHDGRGVTISIPGFTTGTGDFLLVVLALKQLQPHHVLVKYLSALESDTGDNVAGLDNLINDIHSLGNDDANWKEAVWIVINELYWSPSVNISSSLGLSYPISIGEIYDSMINAGLDGVQEILNQTKSVPPIKGGNEVEWLNDFLNVRESIITQPNNNLDFGQSDRTKLWRSVLNTGNVMLTKPLNDLSCYGSDFQIV